MDTVIKKCKCGKDFLSPRWAHRKYCCHGCSVRFWKPNSGTFKKGRGTWNKGKKALKPSYRKGKTWEGIWGKEKSNGMKMNLRKQKYKGAISINNGGYYKIRSPITGKQHLVHQEVWKENNYPTIPRKCGVHHLDGDKLNNQPDNLLLLDAQTHTRVHHLGRKHTLESRKKMSISGKKRVFTKEHRDKINAAIRRNK